MGGCRLCNIAGPLGGGRRALAQHCAWARADAVCIQSPQHPQVRAPTHIVSTICDDRGEEPTYCGVTMSELMEADANVGDAIG